MNEFGNDIRKAVDNSIENTQEQKERIWRHIDAETRVYEMKKRKNTAALMAASIVLAVLVVFTAFTPTGRAAVNKIIAIFASEKAVVTNVEGEQEDSSQNLYVDGEKEEEQVMITQAPDLEPESSAQKSVSYVMYVDEERYSVQKGEDEDIIFPKDYPEDYPPVDMRISQVQDKTVELMSADLFSQLNETYDNVYNAEPVSFAHVSGQMLMAFNGDINGDKDTMPQWDDEVTKVYILDNTQGGVFVIWVRYFVEAEEGHGARLEQMLAQFEIIPAE